VIKKHGALAGRGSYKNKSGSQSSSDSNIKAAAAAAVVVTSRLINIPLRT
jgi:hypothetical protein